MYYLDERDVTTNSDVGSIGSEATADREANPYGEENLIEIIRELMDSNHRLYAKSILTEKEADVYAKLASFAEYHRTPSLLRYVNRQLEYKMSIHGQRTSDIKGVWGQANENSKAKSRKDKIINLD